MDDVLRLQLEHLVQNAGIEVSHDLQFRSAASFSAVQFNTLARDLRETWGLPER